MSDRNETRVLDVDDVVTEHAEGQEFGPTRLIIEFNGSRAEREAALAAVVGRLWALVRDD